VSNKTNPAYAVNRATDLQRCVREQMMKKKKRAIVLVLILSGSAMFFGTCCAVRKKGGGFFSVMPQYEFVGPVELTKERLSERRKQRDLKSIKEFSETRDLSKADDVIVRLESEHYEVRTQAALALGDAKYKKATDALLSLLTTGVYIGRDTSAAARSLALFEEPKAVPLIKQHLAEHQKWIEAHQYMSRNFKLLPERFDVKRQLEEALATLTESTQPSPAGDVLKAAPEE
jgi:HEAT repeat protein